jgi:hypothetical protein
VRVLQPARGVGDDAVLVPPWSAEVFLGRATHDMYAALPSATRHELRMLPDAVRRLELDAGALRSRIEELNSMLAVLESDGRLKLDVTTRSAEVRAEREAAGRELASVVTILENVRLELLRFQADASSVRRLATVLAAPREARDASTSRGTGTRSPE